MQQAEKKEQGRGNEQSNEKVTEGRDTGLGRDPKREQLPINDELEILESQKGKKVDADLDLEKDRPPGI